MHASALLATLLLLPLTPLTGATGGEAAPAGTVYHVRQTVKLDQIDPAAERVRWWVAIPGDERLQEVLDFAVVAAPGPWRVEREAENGNRFLYVEAGRPGKSELEVVVEFTLRRRALRVAVDPDRVGPITADHARSFADAVRRDAPHMQVTERIERLAREAVGDATNPAVQVRKLLEYVADFADHYSKDASKPACGIGDAEDCLSNEGGCCTDLHSLYISLARSLGIPARLQFGYRLLPHNADKEVDPGYRCWVESFLPGYGWVPADIVEADAVGGDRELWLSGLSERRLWLNAGRDFVLNPAQDGPRVNSMIMGYAEIDGVPARVLPDGDLQPQLTRKVRFQERPAERTAAR